MKSGGLKMKGRYIKRISIFLAIAALIAGMAGCGPAQHTLTIASVLGGSVIVPGEGNFVYDEGMKVNLLAVADEGYRFVSWSGNVFTIGNINAASTNIIVNGDYFIMANFEATSRVQYSLTITSTAGGSVTTPGVGTFACNAGTVVNLAASATSGYRFVNWTGDVGTVANINGAASSITMNGNYSIAANFALEIALEIWDWSDLDDTRGNLGGSYTLMNDMDSTTAGYEELASSRANEGKGWQPIGTYDDQFTGSFDGQGYEIRDFFIERADESGVGLFGDIGSGVIKNIGVVSVTVTGDSSVGGLVGSSTGTVSNSYSAGSVAGSEYVGGLVGYSTGTVSDSYSVTVVTGSESVGGLVGVSTGTVSNSYSSVNVAGTGQQESLCLGGLVGINTGNVSSSYSSGNVTGTGEQQSLSVGGLAGLNTGTVNDSHSSANVTGTGEQQSLYIGGLVGINTGNVGNSYCRGNVIGTGQQKLLCVGGLVGVNMGGSSYTGTVTNSYSSGNVTGEQRSLYVGGMVGANTGTVNNSFWDIETSGRTTSAGGTGKTTAQMKSVATFSGAAWDIITVANLGTRNTAYTWNIVDGQTYPFLSWQS
jgi:hypothetical protein